MKAKKAAGRKVREFINDGMTIGLGTGSTVYWSIQTIGSMIKNGLKIKAVPTSDSTAELANEVNIPLIELNQVDKLDLTIDGADEVDPNFNLIKGGGGALLREKIVASASKNLIIVVDESKLVTNLGDFSLPIEVTPFNWQYTQKMIEKLGCKSKIRKENNKIFVTDNQNYIIDCDFKKIINPEKLNKELKQIPGIVENGLFINMAETVIVGYETGEVKILKK